MNYEKYGAPQAYHAETLYFRNGLGETIRKKISDNRLSADGRKKKYLLRIGKDYYCDALRKAAEHRGPRFEDDEGFSVPVTHVGGDASFDYYVVVVSANETPLRFLYRITDDFRSTANVNCHNIKHVVSWTFVCRAPAAGMFPERAKERLFASFSVSPSSVVTRSASDGFFLSCKWADGRSAVRSVNSYFAWHDGLPHVCELHVPIECFALPRGMCYGVHNFPEKILSWDIECSSSTGKIPSGKISGDRLLQIACVVISNDLGGSLRYWRPFVFALCDRFDDSVRRSWRSRLQRSLELEDVHEDCPAKTMRPCKLFFFREEGALIRAFLSLIAEEDPTCIMGYNTSGFDVPFLCDRAESLDLTVPSKTFRKKVFSETHRRDLFLPGCATIDVFLEMKAMQQASFREGTVSEERSSSLDHFASLHLGRKKAKVRGDGVVAHCDEFLRTCAFGARGGTPTDVEEECAGSLFYYGLVDALLPHLLASKFGMLTVKRTVAKMLRCPVDRVTFGGVTSQYPFYCRDETLRRGEQLPLPFDSYADGSATDVGYRAGKLSAYYCGGRPPEFPYEGGLVVATAGLYANVAVLDFASLYPSVILYANLSPETVIARREEFVLCQPSSTWTFNRSGGERVRRTVRRDRTGMLPSLLMETLAARARVKAALRAETNQLTKRRLEACQLGYKIVSNSLYGCMASGSFADRRVAELTTAIGRGLLCHAAAAVKAATGRRVPYGDTDSVMVPGLVPTRAESLCDDLNASFDGTYGAGRFKLEFERFAHLFWVLNAKKYAYSATCESCSGGGCENCDGRGKIICKKGLKSVKGDTPPYLKTLEDDVMDRVCLHGESSVERAVSTSAAALLADLARRPTVDFLCCQTVKHAHHYKNANLPQVEALRQKIAAGDSHVSGDKIRYLFLFSDESEPGRVDDRCAFHGTTFRKNIPKYTRVFYMASDDPSINEPFGRTAAKLRVCVPLYLDAISSTAQSVFADQDYEKKREDFRRWFDVRCCETFFPKRYAYKSPKNSSKPAGCSGNNRLPPFVEDDVFHVYHRAAQVVGQTQN